MSGVTLQDQVVDILEEYVKEIKEHTKMEILTYHLETEEGSILCYHFS